ncbi:MAG: hypothetical protein GF308_10525 [Candidatus Heimdallarchaeota archaeon]|nr:hypothetical protein [Candidatus Heimdallarchaeota archaeon]
MTIEESLTSIADKILTVCKKEQIKEAEIFLTREAKSSASEVPFHNGITLESQSDFSTGLAIRLLVGENRLGFTYSSDIDKESIEEIVHGATKTALPVKGFAGFITPQGKTEVQQTFDPEIEKYITEPATLSELLERSSNKIADHEDIKVSHNSITAVKLQTLIVNTNDLHQFHDGTFYSFELNTAVKDNEDKTTTFRHQVYRTINELDIETIVQETINENYIMNKKAKIDQEDSLGILTARAASDLYGYQFEPMLCLDYALAGMTKLGDKVGDKVASEHFTLYDDATLPGGQYTTPFDDEGAPTQKTILIENGIMKGFLASSIIANRNNSQTTGNCTRGANRRINNYYTRKFNYRPLTNPTNLCIKSGDASNEELFSVMDNGYIINMFTGGIAITDPGGDFNILGGHIYKIENGEIIGGIKQASIAGNWFEIFKNVELIGDKPNREMSSLGSTSYVWPDLLVSSLKFKQV